MIRLLIILISIAALTKSKTQISPFITSGVDADIKELPFLISVQQLRVHLCTGSLINGKYALSSGRCMSNRDVDRLVVEYGSTTIYPGNDERTNTVGVSQILFPPDFNYTTGNNDISIIQLASEVSLAKFYEPFVHLTSTGSRFSSGLHATHAGWGYKTQDERSNILQRASLRVISQAECIEAAGDTRPPSFNNICAMENSVICAGDMGSPLLVNRVLVGVASFRNGVTCVEEPGRYPNVYTAVSFFVSWIERTTGIIFRVNTFVSGN